MHNHVLHSVVFLLGLVSFITCFIAEFNRTKVPRKLTSIKSLFFCVSLIEKFKPTFSEISMSVERRRSMGHREDLLYTKKPCFLARNSRCSLLLCCSDRWKHSCVPNLQDRNQKRRWLQDY